MDRISRIAIALRAGVGGGGGCRRSGWGYGWEAVWGAMFGGLGIVLRGTFATVVSAFRRVSD